MVVELLVRSTADPPGRFEKLLGLVTISVEEVVLDWSWEVLELGIELLRSMGSVGCSG